MPTPRRNSNKFKGQWHIGKCLQTGKRQFETAELARKDAKATRKYCGPRLKQYECPHCGYWHNGHDRPPMWRRHKAKSG